MSYVPLAQVEPPAGAGPVVIVEPEAELARYVVNVSGAAGARRFVLWKSSAGAAVAAATERYRTQHGSKPALVIVAGWGS